MFPDVINQFRNEYYFLSNFYPAEFTDCTGNIWPSVEHYFQAMKTENYIERAKIRKASTPGKAKSMGRNVDLRSNWNSIRLDVMKIGLLYKFRQNPDLRQKLIDTGDAILIEGNYWHDNVYGDCFCNKCKNIRGQNYLGKLLMGIRTRL